MAKKINIELSSLIIERLIIHDIPKHKKSQTEVVPNYSEQESEISDGMRVFFKEKIVSAIQSTKAFNICFDETKESPVPLYIKELISAETEIFISHSKLIANHLLKSQDGLNTAGILLIVDGTISKKRLTIIMKLERDKGLQLKRNEATNSFDMQEIENLMLTQKTRMYKIVLFIQRADFNLKYDGILIDNQIDIRAKKEIQTFFMNDFLGCSPAEEPKISTQKFYNFTKTYIETIEDKVTQAKYAQHLNSYIQKNQNTICPKEFADDYLEGSEHKDNYKKYIREKKISFNKACVKDISLIEEKIKKITIAFENGISVIGNKGSFDDKVRFSKLDDGQDRAEIVSKIRKVT